MQPTELTDFLRQHPPFTGLSGDQLAALVAAARIQHFRSGELILDAFSAPSVEVFVVLSGTVELWHDADRVNQPADERSSDGDLFGFSAMLTERSLGPRVVAMDDVAVAIVPAASIRVAFATRDGARFLAEQGTIARRRSAPPSYSLVQELITDPPLIVQPDDQLVEVARQMTEQRVSYAAVRISPGTFGVVSDALFRERVLLDGLPATAPVRECLETDVPEAVWGESAAEALITLLDRGASQLLVLDRDRNLRGVISAADFTVSSTTAGVSIHEQVRRARTIEELQLRARRVPPMLGDLLSRGLASGRVIAVYSSILDTIVRRALVIIFAGHDELSLDAFTWLSLGSNGRREAVPSSDLDSAAAFIDGTSEAEIARYREVFGQVDRVLAAAGLVSDGHGAVAERSPFARTNQDWRDAAREWLSAPTDNQGAIMTSLLVDGRPIHGDPGLPAVTKVFADLRRHPGTMRLLLEESLSTRARFRSVRDVLSRRDTFDLKRHALLPIVNLARWAALSVGSAVLPTTERLRAAAGSTMLPQERAQNLIEAFEMLQRLRLRYQLAQYQRGDKPSDVLTRDQLSPIDRSMVDQAVREISAGQRRMDNISAYLPAADWAKPPATSS